MSRNSLYVLVTIAAFFGACDCKHGGGGGQQVVGIDGVPSATPNPLDFGTVDTGSTHSKSFSFTNTGSGPLNILSSVVSGDASFSAATQQGVSLQAGDAITISVSFTPQVDGPHTAKLTITTDSEQSPTYVVGSRASPSPTRSRSPRSSSTSVRCRSPRAPSPRR